MKPLIDVLIVNYNTADFVALTLWALKKLTDNPYRVIILDNRSTEKDCNQLYKIVEDYDNVTLERSDKSITGEAAHAYGLNYLTQQVTAPYFAILDADATWLIKGWDTILFEELNEKVKVAGTQAPVGSHKEADFPLVFCMLFETQAFKEINPNFNPPPPPQVGVGAGLRQKYHDAGYTGKVIEMKNTRTYKDGPFAELICAEYYLDRDYRNIFASHFSRGSTLGVNKYMSTGFKFLYKTPIWGRWLLRHKGAQEKKRWIQICRDIINQQI
ncbi:glycosyltransferase family 2 protein [Patescibacteria group bacterium]|nr:glycosyltransferase family 2 protein [Patescibacteria group bacterium]MBU1889983.1 glycosyltransferase family 2 protein [Patescibacteria group bacterium]